MGLSGSGKSTLVRHFNRLLEPTAGQIMVEGVDVMALGQRELQAFRNQKIGMVFQNFALMPHRSVLDNVAMPLEIRNVAKNERMRQAAAILDIVELGAWGSKFAHELSGGMQQRVGLARALAANPDVLLMDEPFSALDPLIRRQLQDEFIRLSKILKKTTIFITHDLDEAVRIGDRIAIMRDGKLVHLFWCVLILHGPAWILGKSDDHLGAARHCGMFVNLNWHPSGNVRSSAPSVLFFHSADYGFHANYAGLCLYDPGYCFFWDRKACGRGHHHDLWGHAGGASDGLGTAWRSRECQRGCN
jgi:ABC-type nitrate/sulfonate/bicarbonate transport system ATPase subunit